MKSYVEKLQDQLEAAREQIEELEKKLDSAREWTAEMERRLFELASIVGLTGGKKLGSNGEDTPHTDD